MSYISNLKKEFRQRHYFEKCVTLLTKYELGRTLIAVIPTFPETGHLITTQTTIISLTSEQEHFAQVKLTNHQLALSNIAISWPTEHNSTRDPPINLDIDSSTRYHQYWDCKILCDLLKSTNNINAKPTNCLPGRRIALFKVDKKSVAIIIQTLLHDNPYVCNTPNPSQSTSEFLFVFIIQHLILFGNIPLLFERDLPCFLHKNNMDKEAQFDVRTHNIYLQNINITCLWKNIAIFGNPTYMIKIITRGVPVLSSKYTSIILINMPYKNATRYCYLKTLFKSLNYTILNIIWISWCYNTIYLTIIPQCSLDGMFLTGSNNLILHEPHLLNFQCGDALYYTLLPVLMHQSNYCVLLHILYRVRWPIVWGFAINKILENKCPTFVKNCFRGDKSSIINQFHNFRALWNLIVNPLEFRNHYVITNSEFICPFEHSNYTSLLRLVGAFTQRIDSSLACYSVQSKRIAFNQHRIKNLIACPIADRDNDRKKIQHTCEPLLTKPLNISHVEITYHTKESTVFKFPLQTTPSLLKIKCKRAISMRDICEYLHKYLNLDYGFDCIYITLARNIQKNEENLSVNINFDLTHSFSLYRIQSYNNTVESELKINEPQSIDLNSFTTPIPVSWIKFLNINTVFSTQ